MIYAGRPAAKPDPASLSGAAKTSVLLIAGTIASFTAGRTAGIDARSISRQRPAFKINRAAVCIRSLTVVEIAAVTSQRRVAGEGAASNHHCSGICQTGKAAAMRIEEGMIVDHRVAFADNLA